MAVPDDADRGSRAEGLAADLARAYGAFMDILWTLIGLALALALAAAAVALAWWLFRLAFWIAILFIGEAGRAWRGDP